MSTLRLTELAWTDLERLDPERVVAILPVGAVEAHGPHLPLGTDVVIAEAMAAAGARRLAESGVIPLLLPGLVYTPAPFAADFPGTLSIRPATLTALIEDLAASFGSWRVRRLALANAHFDPEHVGALRQAVERTAAAGGCAVVFPDLTRKAWARRLTEEFRSGSCHAGRYEGSVVLAARPELVREAVRQRLEPNRRSLSEAIRDGKRSFREIGGVGGSLAYFGDPAAASAGEGRETIERLGAILAEAVRESL